MTLDPSTFPGNLRHFRLLRGMTQGELAKAADMTAAHVSHFESGNRLPSLPNFVRLSIALRIDPKRLLEQNPRPDGA